MLFSLPGYKANVLQLFTHSSVVDVSRDLRLWPLQSQGSLIILTDSPIIQSTSLRKYTSRMPPACHNLHRQSPWSKPSFFLTWAIAGATRADRSGTAARAMLLKREFDQMGPKPRMCQSPDKVSLCDQGPCHPPPSLPCYSHPDSALLLMQAESSPLCFCLGHSCF